MVTTSENSDHVRLVIISDTHNFHDSVSLPDGDILVHCGDITGRGSKDRMVLFAEWFATRKHTHKVVIGGNHDFCLEEDPLFAAAVFGRVVYLCDSGIEIMGLKFYGSPYQPWFHDWAFNLDCHVDLRDKWDLIPPGTDVLLTHCPPYGILDKTLRGERVGCHELKNAIVEKPPRVHAFGHIHEDYGWAESESTLFVNAAICTLQYQPTNAPIVVDIPLGNGKAKIVEHK